MTVYKCSFIQTENNYIFLCSIEKKETKLTLEEGRTGKATDSMQCFKFNAKSTLEHTGIQISYNSVTIILKFLKPPSFPRLLSGCFLHLPCNLRT